MKKKFLTILLVMTMVLVLQGCKEESADSTQTSTNTSALSDTSVETSVSEETSEETVTGDIVYEGEDLIEICDYKNLEVDADIVTLTDSLIDSYVVNFFAREAQEIDWGRPIENGETAVIDFTGYLDGEAFDGGSSTDYELTLGSNTFIDGFEAGVVGMSIGETRDLNLTFPENYGSSDLAGKDVVFTVTLNGIIPEVNDENVAEFESDLFSDVAGLREYLTNLLTAYYEESNKESIMSAAMLYVEDNSKFGTINSELMEDEKDYINKLYSETASNYGMEVSEFLAYNGTSLEEMATEYAKQYLIIAEIAELENITVSDEDIEDAIDEICSYYDMTEEDFLDIYPKEDLTDDLLADKVYDFLAENNTAKSEE